MLNNSGLAHAGPYPKKGILMPKRYFLKEIAYECKVSIRTLYRMEEDGIIQKFKRHPRNRRKYCTEKELQKLKTLI